MSNETTAAHAKRGGGKQRGQTPQEEVAPIKSALPTVEEIAEGRKVLYPKFFSAEMVGDNALSTKKDESKNKDGTFVYPAIGAEGPHEFGLVGHLLGSTYNEELAKQYGAEAPTFLDRNKKAVYCLNNLTNRPVNFGRVEDLVQEIRFSGPGRPKEQRRWQFNSEPMIISQTGIVLNGQKQLIACYLAEQDRNGPQKLVWQQLGWDRPVQIDKVVNFGVEDNEAVVDTIDQVQPRSLADVIYRSQHFSRFKPEARKNVSRMADYAIRLLWDRTGAGYKPKKGAGSGMTAPRRTTPEAMDFLRRHPRLLEAIKHIYEEYGTGEKLKINKELMSPGYASALMYLMGTSATEGPRNGLGQVEAYADGEPAPNESALDFEFWDGAKEFWRCLTRMPVDGNVVCPQFQEILDTVAALQPPIGSARPALADRLAVLTLAWQKFLTGDEFKRAELTPEWTYRGENSAVKILKFPYTVGGIDLGHAPGMTEEEGAAVETKEDSSVPDSDEMSPEQQAVVEKEKAKVDSEKVAQTMQRLREARQRKQQEIEEADRARQRASEGGIQGDGSQT